MNLDCTNYDSKDCPKKIEYEYEIKIDENDTINFLSVGCWGVYCWEGYKDVYVWKEMNIDDEKNKKEEVYNRILKNKNISNEKIKNLNYEEKREIIKDLNYETLDLFEKETELYGQKWVVDGMKSYSEYKKTEALFLAGDNVYNYNIPKQKLIELIQNEKYPSKKKYKSDYSISGHDIKKQLSLGFENCLKEIKVNNFFVGVGNHDIETCEDLNEQLNYKNKYDFKGMYYNIIYNIKDENNQKNNFKINFIIIDTNLFPEKLGDYGKSCSGDKFTEEQMKEQIDWILKVLGKEENFWNIIIGHVPYKANGHKEKNKTIFNESLNLLFDKIKEEKNKVHLYICADEHNQQFLLDKEHDLNLAIVGSGGTALDYNIQNSEKYENETLYMNACFGFISLSFDREILKVDFYETNKDLVSSTFSYVINI